MRPQVRRPGPDTTGRFSWLLRGQRAQVRLVERSVGVETAPRSVTSQRLPASRTLAAANASMASPLPYHAVLSLLSCATVLPVLTRG